MKTDLGFKPYNISIPDITDIDAVIKDLRLQAEALSEVMRMNLMVNEIEVRRAIQTEQLPPSVEKLYITLPYEQYYDNYQAAIHDMSKRLLTVRPELESKLERSFLHTQVRCSVRSQRYMELFRGRSEGFNTTIVPGQFGKSFRGYTLDETRQSCGAMQTVLPLFDIMVMLITHPDRLSDNNNGIMCGADLIRTDHLINEGLVRVGLDNDTWKVSVVQDASNVNCGYPTMILYS